MKQMHQYSDVALIGCFRSGNERAFQILYERYHEKIMGTIIYYVRNRIMAEDLAQECYIKIIRGIQTGIYSEEGKFLPWALRIVRNHCMDHLRSLNRQPYMADVSAAYHIVHDGNAPDRMVMKKQVAEEVRSFIGRLSKEQRTVVEYKYFEELSFKEIAVLTHTGINTSLGRMRYAIANLRGEMNSFERFVIYDL